MFGFFKKKNQAAPAPAAQPSPPLVVPRIKLTRFHQDILGSVSEPFPAGSLPIVEPLMGDLLLTYAVDTGVSFQMMSPDSLPELGLQAHGLRPLAEANAINVLKGLRVHEDEAPVARISAEENMAACTALFPALWSQIQNTELGGQPLLAAFVHRDVVYYAPHTDEGKAALQRQVDTFDFNDRHALSRQIFAFDQGRWSVLPG